MASLRLSEKTPLVVQQIGFEEGDVTPRLGFRIVTSGTLSKITTTSTEQASSIEEAASLTGGQGSSHLQLLARVERTGVHLAVDVGAELLQGAVVSESPPLDVDTHPPFVSIQQLNVPHVLHVAGVGARPLEKQACVTTLS